MGNIFDLGNGNRSITKETPNSNFVLDQDLLRDSPDVVNRKLNLETLNLLNSIKSYKSYGIVVSSVTTPVPTTTYNMLFKENTTSAPSVFNEYRVKILDKNIDNLSSLLETKEDIYLALTYKVCASKTELGSNPIPNGSIVEIDYLDNTRQDPLIVGVVGTLPSLAPTGQSNTGAKEAFDPNSDIQYTNITTETASEGMLIIGGKEVPAIGFKVKNWIKNPGVKGLKNVYLKNTPGVATPSGDVYGPLSDLMGKRINVKKFVIHETAGTTVESAIQTFWQRSVVAHLIMDIDGTVYQCGDLTWKGRHVGIDTVNSTSIGIEIVSPSDPGLSSLSSSPFKDRPILGNTFWNGQSRYILPFEAQFEACLNIIKFFISYKDENIDIPRQWNSIVDGRWFNLGAKSIDQPNVSPGRRQVLKNLADPSAGGIFFHSMQENHYDGAPFALYCYYRLELNDTSDVAYKRMVKTITNYKLNEGIDLKIARSLDVGRTPEPKLVAAADGTLRVR